MKWLLVLTPLFLIFAGCVTKKKMVERESQVFMMGYIHGQESCAEQIINYNKFLFGDRIDAGKKKKELKEILK